MRLLDIAAKFPEAVHARHCGIEQFRIVKHFTRLVLLGADMVIYQSLDALKKAVHAGNQDLNTFCGACFDGCYPTGDVTPEMLESIENDRLDLQQKQKNLNI